MSDLTPLLTELLSRPDLRDCWPDGRWWKHCADEWYGYGLVEQDKFESSLSEIAIAERVGFLCLRWLLKRWPEGIEILNHGGGVLYFVGRRVSSTHHAQIGDPDNSDAAVLIRAVLAAAGKEQPR